MVAALFLRVKEIFNKRSIWVYYIIPFLLLSLIRICMVYNFNQPWLFPDEFRQLGHARYFSGGEHFLFINTTYANFGYGLLISPIFWFFSAPVHIYKAILIFNALVSSAMYFPLFYLLKRIGKINKEITAIISLVVSLYPAYIVQNMMAWQEAVMPFFYVLSVALFIYLLDKVSYYRIAFFSLNIGLLYSLHSRSLPIIIIAFLFLLFLSWLDKKNKIKYFFGLLILVISFILVRMVNALIISGNWQSIINYSPLEMTLRVSTWQGVKIFLTRALGQTLYLVQATYGVVIFGVLYLLSYLRENKHKIWSDNNSLGVLYLLLTSIGTFVLSSLFTAVPYLSRPDLLIYGRYNEVFLAVFLVFGLLNFYKKVVYKNIHIMIGIFLLVASFIIEQNKHSLLVDASKINIVGISFWAFSFKYLNLVLFSLIIFSLFLLLKKVFEKKFMIGICLLLILFYLTSLLYYNTYFNYRDYNANRGNEIINIIKELDIKQISYEYNNNLCKDKNLKLISEFANNNFYSLNWQLPHIDFELFNSDMNKKPKYDYVIANSLWTPLEGMSGNVIFRDFYNIQVLWKVDN